MKEIIVLVRDIPQEQEENIRNSHREHISSAFLHPIMDPLRIKGFSKSEIKIVNDDNETVHHILCNLNDSNLK